MPIVSMRGVVAASMIVGVVAGWPVSRIALGPDASAAAAQPSSPPIASITRHRGAFNGQSLEYVATVEQVHVNSGTSSAELVTTSYERQGGAEIRRRPVIFAFNGGPGASSSPLHLGALGPRRYAIDGTGERVMRDNPFSPLDAADLVFIDPVGTGFSRPRTEAEGKPFWSTTGDATSVAFAIEAWLDRHDREASPRYLCGESYGTTRAAEILASHPELRIDGVLLLSMTGGPTDPDEALAMLVPTYAVAAAFHGRADAAGRSPRQIFDEAEAFGRGDYLAALRRGAALPLDERDRVATALAGRIGLPVSLVRDQQLRVDRGVFMRRLLEARGLRTGQLDSRVTGPLAEFEGKTPPYDDPSMPGARPFKRPTPHLYFTEELRVQAPAPYVTLNLEVNARWQFDHDRAMQEPLALVADAMRARPELHVFWIAGLHDLTTPLENGRYLLERAAIPAGRATAMAVPTGHMPYEGDEALGNFTNAVRRFVSGAP